MHHALLYISTQRSLEVLPTEVQLPSTDVSHILVHSFGVDNARSLHVDAHKRPFEAEKRSFVISANSFTVEAQNALLKLLEEPPHSAQFYIMVTHENVLLPTLRSRLHVMEGEDTVSPSVAWQDFTQKSLAERLALIADLAKNKHTAELNELIGSAIQDPRLPRQTALLLDTYGRQSGASKKMLLELASVMYT